MRTGRSFSAAKSWTTEGVGSYPAHLGRNPHRTLWIARPQDIDWGHGNLFPKFPDQVIHSIQIVPAASPASAVHAGNLDQADGRSKRRRVHDDALLKNKFETVIKNAAQRWPNRQKRPPVSAMVEELIRLGKAQGYDRETFRKILSGTYQPAKRLGISTDW
jgi:hypothetical protein